MASARCGEPEDGRALAAFAACGIEIEYAIVRRDTLDVAPVADQALRALAGSDHVPASVARGMFGWSNELVLHVLELKNDDPTVPMALLARRFDFEVREMNATLRALGARLMPGGMHPWMDPRREAHLWPHANAGIYRAYDRIFDCRTHGYANLQSMHVNLPFAGDGEFARLHDAARLVLPILPALAASSPYVEGRRAPHACHRLAVYRANASRFPQITGALVPDRCDSRAAYESSVLGPMFAAIAPYDPERVLQAEWLNARGAIPRFQRSAIEIRLLDTQECPGMDIGVAALVTDLVQWLYESPPASPGDRRPSTERLATVLDACIRDAEDARIEDAAFLAALGVQRGPCHAGELWERIGERLAAQDAPRTALWRAPLDRILTRGTLARRLLARGGRTPDRRRLHEICERLCDALETGTPLD